ncbi:MAG: VWA domain-containing protein [Longimicrobiales bacterium]|jgi:Ca-activated chloride channel family protein
MFRFNDAAWLWALTLVPVLVLLVVQASAARRRALEAFADVELVQRLTRSVNPIARRWKSAMQIVAVALLAVALARPQFGSRVETIRSSGQDIVVAIDLSQSMLAQDVSPNRLERARLAVYRLMERLSGDRVGLVAFAADAFVQSPLTLDYRAAGMFLNAMTPELMPIQGTDLGAALRTSLEALDKGAREARVLVLVTDAEDHEDDFSDILSELRAIDVYIVVIGTNEGAPIPVYDERGVQQGFLRDEDGSVVTTRVGEGALQSLADQAGATIVRASSDGTALDQLVDRIASGEGDEFDAREVTRFEEQYQIFLALALLLLLTEALLSDRRTEEHEWVGRFE